jgi:hypothetical protein
MRRAVSIDPQLSPAQVEAALAQLDTWTETVPDSASDAYTWEVERPVDKRVIRAEFLAADARAAQALERRSAAPVMPGAQYAPAAPTVVAPTPGAPDAVPGPTLGPSAYVVGATPIAARYKLFVDGTQRGPFALDDVVQQLTRGEIDPGTRIWNMQWNPRTDKWKLVADIPEVMAAIDTAIPDPDDDGVPDPE